MGPTVPARLLNPCSSDLKNSLTASDCGEPPRFHPRWGSGESSDPLPRLPAAGRVHPASRRSNPESPWKKRRGRLSRPWIAGAGDTVQEREPQPTCTAHDPLEPVLFSSGVDSEEGRSPRPSRASPSTTRRRGNRQLSLYGAFRAPPSPRAPAGPTASRAREALVSLLGRSLERRRGLRFQKRSTLVHFATGGGSSSDRRSSRRWGSSATRRWASWSRVTKSSSARWARKASSGR